MPILYSGFRRNREHDPPRTPTGMAVGWRVFGLGVLALGAAALASGDFLPGQSAPKHLPGREGLAYAAAVFMIVAGAAMTWRRTAGWGAAAALIYFGLGVVALMDLPVVVAHYDEYLAYESITEQLAIAIAGLIAFAEASGLDAPLAERLVRVARLAFGLCALVWGGAHFVYLNLTAPLVPEWLPPGQTFWAYATGIAHIAGGLAIVSGVQAGPAAILLTVMYAAFTPLVHLPQLLARPSDPGVWAENAINLALTGVAWVVADSLARPKRA